MARYINLRADGSEMVPYNRPEYHLYSADGQLSGYQNMKVACHWHDEWEFSMMTEGSMGYFVNGETFTLQEGQVAFINSRCIHYNYSIDGQDAKYICTLLPPSVFGGNELIRERYIEPLIRNRAMAYRIMDRSSALPLVSALKAIHDSVKNDDACMGLTVMHCGFQVLERLYRDMADIPAGAAAGEPRLEALHGMIGFVQNHYSEGITLAEIAAAGNVSKSSCCSIFRQYLQQTPVGYLTGYRLERSTELLRSTNLSVTEIAMHTGFASQSYFTETFRRHSGITPTEYRRRQGK